MAVTPPKPATRATLAYTDAGPVPTEGLAVAPIEVFVQPGDLFVGDDSFRPRTLLGSCVSITLWHPASRRGGLSHFLLPNRGQGGPEAPRSQAGPGSLTTRPDSALDARYGDEALELMLRQLRQQGIAASQLQAKIFGGGDMFPDQAQSGRMQVGRRNGLAARALLEEASIRVVSASLFGIGHRQVIFDLGSGDVWVHQVRPAGLAGLAGQGEKMRRSQ